MADVRAQLVQAYGWIKEGKKAEAEALLIRILGNDEKNADAWWLLANALTDPAEQAEALDQLLELRPGDDKATKMLARLRLTPPAAPAARPAAQAAPARPAPPPPPRPAAPPPPPARVPDLFDTVDDDGDPFADVKSSDDDPFAEVNDARKRRTADPFDDQDDPFAVAEAAQKKKPSSKSSSASFERPERAPSRWDRKEKANDGGGNRLLMVLGIVVVGLVACGLICAFVWIQFQQGALNMFNQMIADPTVQAALADPTLQAAIAADPTLQAMMQSSGMTGGFASARVPTDTTSRGPLMPNQTGSAEVDTFTDDSWIFNADAGARYTVEVTATDGQLDPQVAIYGADNQLIAQNDDIDFMDNRNSRVEFTASQNGIYTIIVSAFGEGGSYQVVVRR